MILHGLEVYRYVKMKDIGENKTSTLVSCKDSRRKLLKARS